MSSSAESVRVIARFRPQRDQLVKGGKDGVLSASKQGKGVGTGVAGGATASGTVNAATGFKLDYAADGKSLSYSLPKGVAGTAAGAKPALFTFDAVLNPASTQEEAFDAIAKETIADVLKGYNGTIFAYGQTGSGKSFSMFGPSGVAKLRGVIPRAADAIFDGIAASDEMEEVTIKISFLEVYKESIRDLLQPKASNLKIRELPSGETYVQNLTDEYVAGPEDILQLLMAGEKNRTTASTDMNEVSSRSHSVLIIVVNMKLKDGSVRVGKLNLADLAGSERIERTNATGNTLEEAKKINQSLSALGNCISALTEKGRAHIPYRDSVLTFLLSDSLGGNTKTTLLVALSPEENDCNETLSSLNFAKRAKRIKNSVSVNVQFSVAELMVIVAGLRKELTLAHKTIAALQSTLRTLAAGGSIPKEMMTALLKPMAAPSSAGHGGTGSTGTAEEMRAMEAIGESSEGSSGAVPAPMLGAALAPLGVAGAAVAAVAIGSTTASTSAPSSSSAPPVTAASPRSAASSASPRAASAAPPATAAAAAASAASSNGTAATAAAVSPSSADVAPLPGLLDEDELVAPPTALLRLPTLMPTLPSTPPTSTSPVPPGALSGSEPLPPMLPPDDSGAESFKLATDGSEDLQTAHDEIVALRSLLDISQQSAQAKEEAWETEREQLQAELAAAKAAAASPPVSAGAAAAGGAAVGLLAGAGLAAAAASSSPTSPSSSSTTSPSKPQLSLDTSSSSSSSSSSSGAVPILLPVPLTSPRARAPSSVASSSADSALISSLKSKNDRLEKQMAEMKETWTAYLDLILENQKAQEAERASRERALLVDPEDVGAANANARGPKIVKPVKKGFFSNLFRSKTLDSAAVAELNASNGAGTGNSTPQRGRPSGTFDQGSASASSSAFNSPNPPDHRRTGSNTMVSPGDASASASSRRQTMGTPSTAVGASPASPGLARSRSTVSHISSPPVTPLPPTAARASFANAIRIGFLSKKPVGFSMSRAWKQRLFVLRPTCIDWYQLDPSAVTIQSANAAADGAAAPSSFAAAADNGLSDYFCPSNLIDHLRGSISLDCQTSCVCVSYADAPFGFELTTRDKHSKLQASTDPERQAWVRDLLAVLQCIKSGLDPATLIPGALAPHSSPDDDDAHDGVGFTLDPNLVSNANFLLQSHLERLPEPSPPPTTAANAAAAAAAPATATDSASSAAVAPSSSASPAAPAPSASPASS